MYRNIKSTEIIKTLKILTKRISERFPASNLKNIAEEINHVAERAESEKIRLQRPLWLLRLAVVFVFISLVTTVVVFVSKADLPQFSSEIAGFLQGLEAGVNIVIITIAGLISTISLESRIKRKRALAFLQELRSLAHVVDMHQLTKDPDKLNAIPATPSSPSLDLTQIELSRYLNYFSEMLALIGKLSAMYIEFSQDSVILEAASDIESLTNNLCHKIWQKISIIHLVDE